MLKIPFRPFRWQVGAHCLLEASKLGLILDYDPSRERNRYFYQCLGKHLRVDNVEDVIDALENYMLHNRLVPVENEVSMCFILYRIRSRMVTNKSSWSVVCCLESMPLQADMHSCTPGYSCSPPSPRKNGYPLKNNKLELPTGNREFNQLLRLRLRLLISEILFLAVCSFSRFVDFGFTMWLNKRIMKSAIRNVFLFLRLNWTQIVKAKINREKAM